MKKVIKSFTFFISILKNDLMCLCIQICVTRMYFKVDERESEREKKKKRERRKERERESES